MFAVMRERGVVRRIGVDLGLREHFVHPDAQKYPVSLNAPGKRDPWDTRDRREQTNATRLRSRAGRPATAPCGRR